MNLTEKFQSAGMRKWLGRLYGWGAAVVILGALFKIMYWPGANYMLIAGLGLEALIFFVSAWEPPHEQPDWTLVYPELLGLEASEEPKQRGKKQGLAELLEGSDVDKETFEKLTTGLKNLSVTTNKLADISNASVATDKYMKSMETASTALGGFTSIQNEITNYGSQLSDSYKSLADAVKSESSKVSFGDDSYANSLQNIKENLSALNAAYELQLKGINEQLKTSQQLNDGMTEIRENLTQSVSDTVKYKNEVSALSAKLSELNSIYGNMLSAMNAGKGNM